MKPSLMSFGAEVGRVWPDELSVHMTQLGRVMGHEFSGAVLATGEMFETLSRVFLNGTCPEGDIVSVQLHR